MGSSPSRRSDAEPAITITVDGEPVTGVAGQTLAGILLGADHVAWRRTSVTGASRGVFCGIGVCFDCIVAVNGDRDVRACQRRASPGDVLDTQQDELPEVRP